MSTTDPLRQAQARAFNRSARRLGLADHIAGLAALVMGVALAGRLGGWGSVAWLALVLPAVALPFGYAGYRLSRRYGLSRQTAGGWLADRAKGYLVGLVLGGVAAAGLLAVQRLTPWWPLLAWAGGVLLVAALAVLWPVVLLPLFLRSEPLAGGRLADELRATTERSGLRVRELRLLKMGEKTSAANAMVAGLGPTLRIYVSDTMVEGDDEQAGLDHARVVLAHELGHHLHHDMWRGLAWSAAAVGAGLAGAWVAVEAFAPRGPAT